MEIVTKGDCLDCMFLGFWHHLTELEFHASSKVVKDLIQRHTESTLDTRLENSKTAWNLNRTGIFALSLNGLKRS